MNKNSITLLILLFVFITSFSCTKSEETTKNNGIINIVTTTGMIEDIVKNVAGDLVQTTSLIGTGVDPHLYKASAGDVSKLSEADLIFYNGLHLEGKITEVLAQMNERGISTVAVAETVDESKLLTSEYFQGYYDPHIWFDVMLWKNAVDVVKNTLVEMDNKNQASYENNAELFNNKLDELQEYITQKLNEIPNDKKVLITAHDAFGYFGKGYGFEVMGLQGISTESEASAADIRKLADVITSRKIPAIFVETSVSPKYIEALKASVKSRGFNVEVGGLLFSDSMGSEGTIEGTYIGMFKHNVDTIVSALNK